MPLVSSSHHLRRFCQSGECLGRSIAWRAPKLANGFPTLWLTGRGEKGETPEDRIRTSSTRAFTAIPTEEKKRALGAWRGRLMQTLDVTL